MDATCQACAVFTICGRVFQLKLRKDWTRNLFVFDVVSSS